MFALMRTRGESCITLELCRYDVMCLCVCLGMFCVCVECACGGSSYNYKASVGGVGWC